MSNPTAVPRRRRHRTSLVRRFWWVGLVVLAAGVAGASFYFRPHSQGAQPVEGYVIDPSALAEQYIRQTGKPLTSSEPRQDFDQATVRMLHRDYQTAAALLEQVAKAAPVPVVFNNLGVLYAELNDRARAVNAFRQALARDVSYAPVRANLQRLRGFTSDTELPVSREIEPNDSPRVANPIALDSPVDGEIAAGTSDSDTYRADAPPPPRDILSVEIANHSPALSLGLRIYDSDLRLTDSGVEPQPPGASLSTKLSPPPGATLYFQIWGVRGTSGAYTLRVRPTRSYDSFEPNDDIFSAHEIALGQPLSANIMDALDTDFYSFRSPHDGTVTVEIENRSSTLIPAITLFGPDKANIGFGPDLRQPDASLKQTVPVQANQPYFIQVWSQGHSFGNYSIVVQ